jgi:hypothetical protein
MRDHAAGGAGGGHRRGVRRFERADEVDAVVQASEPPGAQRVSDELCVSRGDLLVDGGG